MAKLLAKQCDIGDASRGSLSSYAYTLMVLHYLQQVNPPVIPVLQEVWSSIKVHLRLQNDTHLCTCRLYQKVSIATTTWWKVGTPTFSKTLKTW